MPPFGKELYEDVVDRLVFVHPFSTKQTALRYNTSTVDTSSTETISLQEEKQNKESLCVPSSPLVNRFLSFNPCVTARIQVNCNSLIPEASDITDPSPTILEAQNYIKKCHQGCSNVDGNFNVIEEQQEEGEEVDLNDFIFETKINYRDSSTELQEWKAKHSKSYMAVMHSLLWRFRALEEASTTAASKANEELEGRERNEAEDSSATTLKEMNEQKLRERNKTQSERANILRIYTKLKTKHKEAEETLRLLEEWSIPSANSEHTNKTKKNMFGTLKRTMKRAFSLENYTSSTRHGTQGQKKDSFRKKNFQKIEDHTFNENDIISKTTNNKLDAQKKKSNTRWTKSTLPTTKQIYRRSSSYNSYQMVKRVAVIWS